jgi:type I restriction enzyme M protein
MARASSNSPSSGNTANIGFEQKLWLAADKLRSKMDAAEYKHVVLGLIFLKYISGSFEEHHAKLVGAEGEYAGANPEDPDQRIAQQFVEIHNRKPPSTTAATPVAAENSGGQAT